MGNVLFGYRHVSGVPTCPCRDPGNYLAGEKTDNPLEIRFRCWCGRSTVGSFDSAEELDTFLKENCGVD